MEIYFKFFFQIHDTICLNNDIEWDGNYFISMAVFLFSVKWMWKRDAYVEMKESEQNVQGGEFDVLSLAVFLEDVILFALFMSPRPLYLPFPYFRDRL